MGTERPLASGDDSFRILVDAVTDYAIYMLDAQGNVATWNPGARRFKGYRSNEIIGQHFSRFYTEEDRAAGVPASALKTAAETGKFEAEGWRVRKDGSRFWAHVVIDPIRDAGGTVIGFAKITRDLTERREAQAQLDQAREALFQSQKMESIGQLTGGVAHDFNNVLAAVIGSLELIQRRNRSAGDERTSLLVANAMQAARRGAQLTLRMLAFARRQELEPTDVDLRQLVEGMREMLDRSLGAYATLVIDLPTNLPPVRVDEGQVEMALLNLALNARDAMPTGGPIAIVARLEDFLPDNSLGLKPGRYVGLSVRDTGVGMDAPTLRRCVEPFFTTKGVGQGTGLGLAMVHGLAEQLEGRLALESTPGTGTTATLWLPVVREASQATAQPVQSPRADRGKLRILAVDDDALVLLNTVMMLEDDGHTVKTAYSAADALDALKAEDFDLLVTDQGMPAMSGLALIEAARALRPKLPAVIVTGYAELPPDAPRELPRVTKPFLESQLFSAIDQALALAN
ncbi:MAG: PAS domain S-box protein [Reyranellales bacterium]